MRPSDRDQKETIIHLRSDHTAKECRPSQTEEPTFLYFIQLFLLTDASITHKSDVIQMANRLLGNSVKIITHVIATP